MLTDICFVVMPFGRKPSGNNRRRCFFWKDRIIADFDRIYETIFAPAIIAVPLPEGGKLKPHRADSAFHSGHISVEMHRYIEYSRVVLADITAANANVMYELGHRHRARASGTVVFRQGSAALPFDINTIRAFPYEYEPEEHVALSRELVTKVLSESLVHNALDSPVQLALRELQNEGTDVNIPLQMAERAIAVQDSAEAAKHLRTAIRFAKTNPFLRVRLAVLLKEFGDFDAAHDELVLATRLSPQYGDAFRELGIVLHKLERFDESEGALRQAIQIAPDDYDAWASLGGLLKRMRRYREALAAYEKAIEISRGHSYPLLNAIVLESHLTGRLDLSGSKRDALLRAERGLAAQTDRKPPYNAPWSAFDLGLVRLLLGHEDEFLTWTQKGAELSTANWMKETHARTISLLLPVSEHASTIRKAVAILNM